MDKVLTAFRLRDCPDLNWRSPSWKSWICIWEVLVSANQLWPHYHTDSIERQGVLTEMGTRSETALPLPLSLPPSFYFSPSHHHYIPLFLSLPLFVSLSLPHFSSFPSLSQSITISPSFSYSAPSLSLSSFLVLSHSFSLSSSASLSAPRGAKQTEYIAVDILCPWVIRVAP